MGNVSSPEQVDRVGITYALLLDIVSREGSVSEDCIEKRLDGLWKKVTKDVPDFSMDYGNLDVSDGNSPGLGDALRLLQAYDWISIATWENGNPKYRITPAGSGKIAECRDSVKKAIGYELHPV